MNSQEYWAKREAEQLKHNITEEKEYDKRLQAIYEDMLDGVQGEIDRFYSTYASNKGITIAEAKKRVSKVDIDRYERKAKRYVEAAAADRKANNGQTDYKGYYFSDKANEEMKLYNLTMKVNRLEMLKANIGLELVKGHAELETFMGNILQGRTEAELKRQAGILGKTIRNNAKTANAIVNGSFHNATFSDRIWQYHDLMKADLSKMLQTGLIQGKNPRQLAKELRKYYIGDERLKNGRNGAIYNTERLMRTELARVQTEAQKQQMEKNGFEEYTFIANGGCCDICQGINGKHFKVAKMMPGENAPPMHPHCRCSVAAYEDSEEYEAWLDFLGKGGTTAEYNKMKNNKAFVYGMIASGKAKQTGGKTVTGGKWYEPYDENDKRDVLASDEYRKISRRNDVDIIAQNTGFSKEDIKQIKRHIFYNKHKKYDGYGMLYPDYDMAVAWNRLYNGNYEERDILLLNHELLESKLEKEYNLTIAEAHRRAKKVYDWEKRLYDELGEDGEKDGLL